MEPEIRKSCSYCAVLIPQKGPLEPRQQLDFHSLGLSISKDGCGFCNAVAIQVKPDWQKRWKPTQVLTFEEFIEQLLVRASVTDVKMSPDGGVSWATWNVNLYSPRWLTSYGDTTYRFHIQTCESPCGYQSDVSNGSSGADRVQLQPRHNQAGRNFPQVGSTSSPQSLPGFTSAIDVMTNALSSVSSPQQGLYKYPPNTE